MLNPIDIKFFKLCCTEIGNESETDIAARCPVCGDSKYSKSKKRLHLYQVQNSTLVHCFNCGIHHNVYNFLKTYFPEHLDAYKREMFKNSLNLEFEQTKFNDDFSYLNVENLNISNFENISNNLDFSSNELLNNSNIEKFQKSENSQKFEIFQKINFKELSQESLNYLKSRKLNYYPEIFGKFYELDCLEVNNKYYPLAGKIIIPFYYTLNDKIYGFYSRSIYDKSFNTCNLNLGYKIWNWFNIDKSQPVFIFEGIFDALSFYQMTNEKNIIALCGISIPDERLNELKTPMFCLDNDQTGIKEMIKHYKHNCLIYDTKFKDFNEMLQNNYIPKFNFKSGFSALIELKKLL